MNICPVGDNTPSPPDGVQPRGIWIGLPGIFLCSVLVYSAREENGSTLIHALGLA